MTMNLITGKAGAPHITSSDQGAMQAGLVGNGNYLLQGSDGKFPAVTMQSANKALVPVLNLVIEDGTRASPRRKPSPSKAESQDGTATT